MEFSPQTGAVSGMRAKTGWSQSKAVQAGVGGGLAAAKTREARTQFERTFKQSEEQFNAKMGWEKSKFNKEQAFAQKQADYQEKRAKKAERIGMFGTATTVAKLGMDLANDFEIDIAGNLGFGDEGSNVSKGSGSTGSSTGEMQAGGETEFGGIKGVEGQSDFSGASSGGDKHWSKGFTDSPGTWAIGGATGGMTGSFLAQAMFGEGKTQSTAGGTIGGGVGGYAATGTWQGGVGGAVVGGVLGYLLG